MIGIRNISGPSPNQLDKNMVRKKRAIKLLPRLIKPIYIWPAPGSREKQKVKKLLFFLIIISYLHFDNVIGEVQHIPTDVIHSVPDGIR